MGIDLGQKLVGITRAKSCNLHPEKGSKESKTLTLSIDYSDLTIGDLLTKAISHDVIAWQNGQGRKHFASLANGQVVKVNASRPAASSNDPQVDYENRLAAMSASERESEILKLKAKFGLK
jgi:hypothetical protein